MLHHHPALARVPAAHPASPSLPLPPSPLPSPNTRYSPDLWKLIRWLLVQNPAARPTADELMGLEMVGWGCQWGHFVCCFVVCWAALEMVGWGCWGALCVSLASAAVLGWLEWERLAVHGSGDGGLGAGGSLLMASGFSCCFGLAVLTMVGWEQPPLLDRQPRPWHAWPVWLHAGGVAVCRSCTAPPLSIFPSCSAPLSLYPSPQAGAGAHAPATAGGARCCGG